MADDLDEFLNPPAPAAAGDDIDAFLSQPGGQMVDRQPEDFGVDLSSGGDPWTRFRVGLAPTLEAKTAILDEVYGVGGYRQNERGEFVIPSTSGGPQPEQLLSSRVGDPARFAGENLPEALGGAAAAGLTPFGSGLLATSAIGAAGSFAGGTVADVAQAPGQAKELALQRAKEVPINFALEAATLGAGKIAKKAIAPFAKAAREPENQAVRQAEQELAKRFGEGDLLSVGERTGSNFVQRSESMLSKLPGGAEVMAEQKARQDASLARIRREIIGDPVSTEQVSRDVVDAFDAAASAEREALQAYRDRLIQEASAEVDQFGFGVLGGARVSPAEATEFARVRAASKLVEFNKESERLYGAVEALPGGADAIVPAEPIKRAIREVLASKPRKVPGELQSEIAALEARAGNEGAQPQGDPFTLQPRLVSIAQQVEQLDNMTLSQARELRSELNAIAASPGALGDVTDAPFKKLASAVTDALEQTKESLRATNPDVADAIEAANGFYRQNRPIFDLRGVRELFKRANEPGFIADDKFFISRVRAGDTESVRAIQQFLGPNSPEWRAQVGALWGDMVRRARSEVLAGSDPEGMIDAKKLARDVAKLPKDLSEMIFGDSKPEIVLRLRRLGAAQGKVPASALTTVGPLDIKIRKAETFAAEMRRNFENNVVRPFLRNEVGISDVPPERFVTYFNKSLGTSEGRAVLAKIDGQDPKLGRKVRSAMLLDLLESAETPGAVADLARARSKGALFAEVPERIDAAEIDRLIRSRYGESQQDSVRNFEAVFGKETARNLSALSLVLGAKETTQKTAGAAGGIMAGSLVANLIGSSVKGVSKLFRYRIAATIATSKGFHAWSRFTPGPTPTRTKAVLGAGAALLDDLQREFQGKELEVVLGAIGADPEKLAADKQKPLSVRFK